ncbi:MAG: DUF4336 domain-containing protein [Deltaproteobacteria bacterium]|nr:DUF4336 domain-containing protein [Deltaproteobacteria bacterium]
MPPLQPIATNIWVMDFPLRVGGLQLGTRMTVVQLASGGLWLHSPGPLQPEHVSAVSALGPVQALVAPNAMHNLFLAQTVVLFPRATVYVSPALPAKLTPLIPHEILTDFPPALWKEEISQHVVGGLPKLQEVVFLHHASRTLILTDLAFHIRHSDSWFTRLFMRLNGVYGHFGPSRIFRAMVKDRAALRSSLEQIQTWDFDRVIVAHGEVLESSGKQAMHTQYAWV